MKPILLVIVGAAICMLIPQPRPKTKKALALLNHKPFKKPSVNPWKQKLDFSSPPYYLLLKYLQL